MHHSDQYVLIFRTTQTAPRAHALDTLPAVGVAKIELYIKATEDTAISWTAFLKPFSSDMWLMLFIVG